VDDDWRACAIIPRVTGDVRGRLLLGLEAAAQLTRASLELRLRPSERTARLLGTPGDGPDSRVEPAEGREAERVGRAVAFVAARLPWHPACLPQALAARRMLGRRRIACRLRLGVSDPAATAHAWVTVEDVPVIGRAGLERLVPLAEFD
jgi:hypothetical protein